jgi:hypothetical protein
LPDLSAHLAYLEAEFSRASAAPLSMRRAMLVALLIDAFIERLFEADPERDDILRFRETLASTSPALRQILALCALHPDGPRLLTGAVEVPLAEYGKLPVEDFMVSLYNAHTVQRVLLLSPDGEARDVHPILAEAIQTLAALARR